MSSAEDIARRAAEDIRLIPVFDNRGLGSEFSTWIKGEYAKIILEAIAEAKGGDGKTNEARSFEIANAFFAEYEPPTHETEIPRHWILSGIRFAVDRLIATQQAQAEPQNCFECGHRQVLNSEDLCQQCANTPHCIDAPSNPPQNSGQGEYDPKSLDHVVHELKTWPEYFDKLLSGEKTFEARKDDRNFKVGDDLRLMEWDPKTEQYTGRRLVSPITYILRGTEHVAKDYCILGILGPGNQPEDTTHPPENADRPVVEQGGETENLAYDLGQNPDGSYKETIEIHSFWTMVEHARSLASQLNDAKHGDCLVIGENDYATLAISCAKISAKLASVKAERAEKQHQLEQYKKWAEYACKRFTEATGQDLQAST